MINFTLCIIYYKEKIVKLKQQQQKKTQNKAENSVPSSHLFLA